MLLKCDKQYDATTSEEKLLKAIEALQREKQGLQESEQRLLQEKQGLQQEKQGLQESEQRLQQDLAVGTPLAGWLRKQGTGTGVFGRKSWKNRWFVLKDGWLTYHESDKLGTDSSHAQLLRSAKGGDDGPIELAASVITKDPADPGKFTIACGDRELHIDKYDGNPHTAALAGKVHPRGTWIEAMLSHTGCKEAN